MVMARARIPFNAGKRVLKSMGVKQEPGEVMSGSLRDDPKRARTKKGMDIK